MNYFRSAYDPMNAMAQGMAFWGGMGQAYDLQKERERKERERAALSQMGQGDHLLGFEDNPLAVRPDSVKALYASGNPDLAFKAESLASQPYMLDREMKRAQAMMKMDEERSVRMLPHEIEKMKQLKAAELESKLAAWKKMMPSLMPGGASPANVGMPSARVGVIHPVGGQPQADGVGQLDQALTGQGLSGLTGGSYETEFDLNRGPVVKYKGTSPLEDEKIRRELLLKGEDTYINQQKVREDLRKNQIAELNAAHERIFTLSQARKELDQRRAAGDIDPAGYATERGDLETELRQAKDYRNQLQKQAGIPQAMPEPEKSQQGALPRTPVRKHSGSPPPASAAPTVGAGLPYKMQQDLQASATKKNIETAQGAIESAHAEAGKFSMHMPTMQNLFQLLSTKDVGNRLGQIPGGETMLRVASEDNDNLQKWRNELIDVLKKEGQSQLMNTLPELAIVSDAFPSVTNSPDTNKKSMANLMNLAESTMAAPKFLEDWAAQHGGTLEGARGVFREWMMNNRRYTVEKSNGKHILSESEIIPIDAWAKLRKRFPASEIKRRQESGKIQTYNGKVYFEE